MGIYDKMKAHTYYSTEWRTKNRLAVS